MIAEILQKKLASFGIHYGWVMAILAFFTTMFSSATISIPQVLIIPMTQTFDWKISDVSTSIAVMYVILASMAPFSAALMLRIGTTKSVLISMIFTISGLFGITLIFEKWHLFFSVAICLGLASGIIGVGFSATIATRWFTAKRGLVVGIITAAFAAGQLLFLPLMAWITTVYDWRMAVLPCLFGSSVCGFLFILFGKNWPSELKLPSYGDKDIYIPPPPSKEGIIYVTFSNLAAAIKHPGFWMLASTFFICGLTSSGIVGQHFIPFCADNNVGVVMASSYLAIMGVFNFIGTMGSGWLADRFDNYVLLAIYYGLRGISLIFLPYSDFDVYALTLWAIFFGLDYIATVPPTVRLTSGFFGKVNGPVVFGWIFSAHQFGSALAAYGSGISRDLFATYLPAFLTAGSFCFFATILILYFRTKRMLL